MDFLEFDLYFLKKKEANCLIVDKFLHFLRKNQQIRDYAK